MRDIKRLALVKMPEQCVDANSVFGLTAMNVSRQGSCEYT